MLAHERQKLRALAALAHHGEAGTLEQARQALAEQNVVVSQYHPRRVYGVALRDLVTTRTIIHERRLSSARLPPCMPPVDVRRFEQLNRVPFRPRHRV
jgi:hypothetical protein